MDNVIKIYIELLEEGTPTWRPTNAEKISEDLYRVLTIDDYDPEDEIWEFPPGSIVRVKLERVRGTDYLFAIKP